MVGLLLTTTTTSTTTSTTISMNPGSTYTTIANCTPNSSTTTTTTQPLLQITQSGDPIYGPYNTAAHGSTGGFGGMFSSSDEEPPMAIDGVLNMKYLNFGNYNSNGMSNTVGVNTGFYVTPQISAYSVACGILFATANDSPNRDPLTITLQGTNSTVLNSSYSWILIYSGPTGIDPVNNPNRSTYGTLQLFSNTRAYQSYRLLVTSQRAVNDSV